MACNFSKICSPWKPFLSLPDLRLIWRRLLVNLIALQCWAKPQNRGNENVRNTRLWVPLMSRLGPMTWAQNENLREVAPTQSWTSDLLVVINLYSSYISWTNRYIQKLKPLRNSGQCTNVMCTSALQCKHCQDGWWQSSRRGMRMTSSFCLA